MSDTMKYYYMRLKEDFFDSDEIKILEGMPNGYKYTNLLLKLYLKSLKMGGALRLNEYIPFDDEMIASVCNMDIDTVRVAMNLYKKLGIVDILDDGTIYMLQIQELIGKSSTEAERKQRYRKQIELQKMKQIECRNDENGEDWDNCPDIYGTSVGQHPPEIEIEREIELEIEIEKEKEEYSADEQSTPALAPTPTVKTPYQEIISLYHEICISLPKVRELTDTRKKNIKSRYLQMGSDLQQMRAFFDRVERSDFLTYRNGKFTANLDWIFTQRNYVKIIEGQYDNKGKAEEIRARFESDSVQRFLNRD